MAQLYNRDSGLLVVEGLTADQYKDLPDFDEAKHGIADTGQTFSVWRVPNVEIWFYIPSQNLFYQSDPKEHALLKAAKTLFSAERWLEIKEILDEQGGFEPLLRRLDKKQITEKIKKARGKGHLTAVEVTALETLLGGA